MVAVQNFGGPIVVAMQITLILKNHVRRLALTLPVQAVVTYQKWQGHAKVLIPDGTLTICGVNACLLVMEAVLVIKTDLIRK